MILIHAGVTEVQDALRDLGSNIWYHLSNYVVIPVSCAVVFLAVFYIFKKLNEMPEGDEDHRRIYEAIREGAVAYMRRQYRTMGIIMAVFAFPVGLTGLIDGWSKVLPTALVFVAGAASSAFAGYVGMDAATRSNVRVVVAAERGTAPSLKVAFYGGMVTGLMVVGTSVFGIWVVFLASNNDVYLSIAYGLGSSVAALFAQVGGGIFTKAADIGADLVGKIEQNIPEDDPRNPATIADNVGDNVGDCAGRGADLFESTTANVLGGMVLGMVMTLYTGQVMWLLVPQIVRALGLFSVIVSAKWINIREDEKPTKALWAVFSVSTAFNAAIFLLVTLAFAGPGWVFVFLASITGLVASLGIVLITQYYTDARYDPTMQVVDASQTGPATNVISGLAVGLQSTLFPTIVFVGTIVLSYYLGYQFAIASSSLLNPMVVNGTPMVVSTQEFRLLGGIIGTLFATLGALSMTGTVLTFDTFGPIVDNAAGIAEMHPNAPSSVRKTLDRLDSLGNTTKALAKGFGLMCGVLSSLLLFQSFVSDTTSVVADLGDSAVTPISKSALQNLSILMDLSNPLVVCGLFIGSVVPFAFSAMTINSVSRSASAMVFEVRRQFKEIPGILEGTSPPDYRQCVDISTKAALHEMSKPVAFVVFVPLLTGILFGPMIIGGLLVGGTVCSVLLGIVLDFSGASLDNAKKAIEDGLHGGKHSDAHRAAVVGDTFGDPLKDTAGPSLHIVMKVLNMVAITFAALFVFTGWLWASVPFVE
ncbi:MAG: sodium-translocating pyrophosphatase [Promethearchaeota archaeon]